MDPRHPNLFLVGPSKTGTTSWWDWLDQHPQVAMASVKEPHALNDDHTYTQRPVEDGEPYLALWDGAEGAVRRGEASPWYFYSEAACQAIGERVEDPRVLLTLREPVERLYSFHSQRVFTGNESIADFEQALAAEPRRRRGESLPDRYNPLEGLFYRELLHYAPHVERYLEAFDVHEVRVLRFEDFVTDPTSAYRETCAFLDIDDGFEPDFEPKNPNTTVASARLRDLVREPPAPVLAVTRHVPRAWRKRARALFKRLNTRRVERAPLDQELRRSLAEEARADLERLEALLDWDLSDWKAPSGADAVPI